MATTATADAAHHYVGREAYNLRKELERLAARTSNESELLEIAWNNAAGGISDALSLQVWHVIQSARAAATYATHMVDALDGNPHRNPAQHAAR